LVALPANTIELKYTLYGDTGLTGTVGFTDFMRMTQHVTQSSGATWARGDFNYDGAVNAADFNLLQPNYGQTLPAPAPTPAITPPPTSGRPPRGVTVLPPASGPLVGNDPVPAPPVTSAVVDAKVKTHASKAHLKKKRR